MSRSGTVRNLGRIIDWLGNLFLDQCFTVCHPVHGELFGRTLYLGAGVLSVMMKTSFTFLPVFEIAMAQMKNIGIASDVAQDAGHEYGLLPPRTRTFGSSNQVPQGRFPSTRDFHHGHVDWCQFNWNGNEILGWRSRVSATLRMLTTRLEIFSNKTKLINIAFICFTAAQKWCGKSMSRWPKRTLRHRPRLLLVRMEKRDSDTVRQNTWDWGFR
jgi:hypothetical protein